MSLTVRVGDSRLTHHRGLWILSPGLGAEGTLMTSTVEDSCWISALRRRAVSIALALAVIVLPAVMATPSQSQTFTLPHVFTGAPDGGYGSKRSTRNGGFVRPARACCKQKRV
jgi:hypothetical protein